jgi:serine/threonine-protein kinase
MAAETGPNTTPSQRLQSILASYFEAAERGAAPERRVLLDRYPELANALADFFAVQDRVWELVAPFRTDDRHLAPAETERHTIPYDTDALCTSSPEPRPRIGDYELLGEIARGGMGIVHRARQRSLNRPVAIKVMRGGRLASADDARRFRNEAEAVASLDHPHLIPIYEVGEHHGVSFFSMKLIEGAAWRTGSGKTVSIPARRPG